MTYSNTDEDSDGVIEGDVDNESTVTDDLQAQSASVESEPSDDTDIVRKLEADKKADLDTGKGVLKSSQVPDLAITSVQTVPDESSRLNLSVQEGDVAVQTNTSTTYIFTGGDPSVNNNWSEIVLDVIDAIQGSTISPENVVTQSVTTENTVLDQQADDGSSRHVIKRADGTEMAEIYSDGNDTIINPLNGDVSMEGTVAPDVLQRAAVDGSADEFESFEGVDAETSTQITKGLGTSFETIFDPNIYLVDATVFGSDQSSDAAFIDKVLRQRGSAPTVYQSIGWDSPAGRNYGGSTGMNLEMASGTYDIFVVGTRFREVTL